MSEAGAEDEKRPYDDEEWINTQSGPRLQELKETEDNLAQLLHFAGCCIALLHPDPLEKFTSKTIEFADQEDELDDEIDLSGLAPAGKAKIVLFEKYLEAYYSTLNDVQIALRGSIRKLRTSRASSAPILNPSFGTLVTPDGGSVGTGGVAMTTSLGLSSTDPSFGMEVVDLTEKDDLGQMDVMEGRREKMSVASRRIEVEAWEMLADALEREMRKKSDAMDVS